MAILLASTDFWEDMEVWSSGLQEAMPEMDVRVYPDEGDVNDIEYAVVWKHPRGILTRYPNLKAILSLGAGVDHVISCLLYTSPSPRDRQKSRMPSSA